MAILLCNGSNENLLTAWGHGGTRGKLITKPFPCARRAPGGFFAEKRNAQGCASPSQEKNMKGSVVVFLRFIGKHTIAIFVLLAFIPFFSACELYFGTLGGADQYTSLEPGGAETPFERILAGMSGVWHSRYGAERLDGYRIGKFGENGENFAKEMGPAKLALFPANGDTFGPPYPLYRGGEEEDYIPKADDYYLFYDDTVYGQNEEGEGGNGGWGDLVMRYAGIVRAVNVFNNDEKTGAVIVQYFVGCAPTWSADVRDGGRPFFGMYYRVMDKNKIQMANAVELENLYAGETHYTDTATLQEAIEKNNAVNDSEFISWGIVWPQER
jgi:hypothetical protein